MKTTRLFFLFIIVSILFFGFTRCDSHDYSKDINQVDSLLTIAKQFHQKVLEIDSADIMEKVKIINADFEFVKDSLPGDLYLKSGSFLTQLKEVKKMTSGFPGDYKSLKNETQYSIKQLIDLKLDIENGKFDAVIISKYIEDESEALVILDQHFKKIKLALNILEDQYFVNRTSFYNLYHEYQASK